MTLCLPSVEKTRFLINVKKSAFTVDVFYYQCTSNCFSEWCSGRAREQRRGDEVSLCQRAERSDGPDL